MVVAAGTQVADTIDPTVAGAALFHNVDSGAVAAVARHLQRVDYAPRETVYAEGDLDDRLYIVVSGKVKLGRCGSEGRLILLTVLGPSDVFGELSIFDPGPRTASATALTAVSAMVMDREVLRGWIADHPNVAHRMLRVLARRLSRTDHDVSDLIFTDVPGRVAKQLMRLAQRFGVQHDGAIRIDHDLTQNEIAQLVGASRETVNKVLSEFTYRGWIRLHGKSIHIINSEQLARRARHTHAPGTDRQTDGQSTAAHAVTSRS